MASPSKQYVVSVVYDPMEVDYTAAHSNFATLTASNEAAKLAFSDIVESMTRRQQRYRHHRRFFHWQDEKTPLHDTSMTSTASSERGRQNSHRNREVRQEWIWKGHYIFSFGIEPHQPSSGWYCGRERDCDHDSLPEGGNDLLLTLNDDEKVRARHVLFNFERRTGILRMTACHLTGPVTVGTVTFGRNTLPQALSGGQTLIQIGRLQYYFEFTLEHRHEEAHQALKQQYIGRYIGDSNEPPHPLTSATPSANDLTIRDWTLHGILCAGANSLFKAATHRHGARAAAMKLRVRLTERDVFEVSREIERCKGISRSLRNQVNREYVLELKEVIYLRDYVFRKSDEVAFLYSPLARGTISDLVLSAPSAQAIPLGPRLSLLQQTLKGLDALHTTGWIHRDLKPANIGVLSLQPPRAVIIDLESACFLGAQAGILSERGGPGTFGYLAPERQTDTLGQCYGRPADVWAVGCVGYHMLCLRDSRHIPWLCEPTAVNGNRFWDPRSIEVYQQCYGQLQRQAPVDGCSSFLVAMLQVDQQSRSTADDAIATLESLLTAWGSSAEALRPVQTSDISTTYAVQQGALHGGLGTQFPGPSATPGIYDMYQPMDYDQRPVQPGTAFAEVGQEPIYSRVMSRRLDPDLAQVETPHGERPERPTRRSGQDRQKLEARHEPTGGDRRKGKERAYASDIDPQEESSQSRARHRARQADLRALYSREEEPDQGRINGRGQRREYGQSHGHGKRRQE